VTLPQAPRLYHAIGPCAAVLSTVRHLLPQVVDVAKARRVSAPTVLVMWVLAQVHLGCISTASPPQFHLVSARSRLDLG